MKKILFWLARIFNVDLTIEKIIYRDRIIEVPKEVTVEKLVSLDDTLYGTVTVKGDLIVKGTLGGHGEVACYTKEEE